MRKIDNVVTVDELKNISKEWVENRNKLYEETDIIWIMAITVIENLVFTQMPSIMRMIEETGDKTEYYDIMNYFVMNNRWNERYPLSIGIGDQKEVWIMGGNHRLNIIAKKRLFDILIPTNLSYHSNYGHDKSRTKLTKDGKPFYPHGIMPKWEKIYAKNK